MIIVGKIHGKKSIQAMSNVQLIEWCCSDSAILAEKQHKGLQKELEQIIIELSKRLGETISKEDVQRIIDSIAC